MGKNKINFDQQYNQLNKHIKYLARDSYLISSRIARDGLREAQDYISITQFFVLGVILIYSAQAKQINQKEIIEFTGLDKASVSKAIKGLLNEEYITQIIDKNDRRSKHLIPNNLLQNHFILANKMLLLLEYLFLDR